MNQIKTLSNSVLINDLKLLVSKEKELTAQIINYLSEVQRRRLYLEHGYTSLFQFCMKVLNYSEAESQVRINAMRVMVEIPEIQTKLQSGSLSLTNISQAQSFFKEQSKLEKPLTLLEKKEVLKTLENKSKRECERELIKLLPQKPLPQEKTKLISQTHVQVTVNISLELQEKLDKVKNLLSHKNPNMTQAELLEELANMALEKLDPSQRKQRTASRPASKQSVMKPGNKLSRYIPAKTEQAVWQNAQSKCCYINSKTGEVCESEFQLEIDHIEPLAKGGRTEISNLRLLCRAHNQLEAINQFGFKHMSKFIDAK